MTPAAYGPQDAYFHGHEAQSEPENLQRLLAHQAQIGRHSHGDEEQAQQQSLEGLDVRLEFVAELAVGEQDAGEKRTERHRQAHLTHQERSADDHQESRRSERFGNAGFRNDAQHGPQDVAAAGYHRRKHRDELYDE